MAKIKITNSLAKINSEQNSNQKSSTAFNTQEEYNPLHAMHLDSFSSLGSWHSTYHLFFFHKSNIFTHRNIENIFSHGLYKLILLYRYWNWHVWVTCHINKSNFDKLALSTVRFVNSQEKSLLVLKYTTSVFWRQHTDQF